MVTDCKRFSQHVIEAPSPKFTNAFENRLDKFWQQDVSVFIAATASPAAHQHTSSSK